MSQPGIWSSTLLCKQNPENPRWHVFCWVTWRQLRTKISPTKSPWSVPLHKIHMPCQSSVSFLHLKFQKKIFPIDANCQDMRCTVHQDALCWFLRNNALSCSMSRVLFSWTQRAHMSTKHPPLPRYLPCLSLLIPIKLQQLFFGHWGFKSRSRWLDVTAQTWCTSHLVRWSPWKLSTTWKVHPIPNGCIDFLFAKIDVPMAIQAAASWVEVSIRIKTMTLWKSPIGCVVTDVDDVCGEWKRKISPKNMTNSQKQKQLPNTQWVKYVYCPALLTLEVGRARRNHGTNTLWKTVFPKAFAILWKLKGQYSRSLWEGFFSKNCCPPHSPHFI